MQRKLFVYQSRLLHGFHEFSIRNMFVKQSLLTKDLSFETIDEQGLYNKDDVLDMTALDIAYDDFSFFSKDKTSKVYPCSNEKNNDNAEERSWEKQLTVADLVRNVHKQSNIPGQYPRRASSLDDVVWQGKAKLVNGGLG